MSPFLKPRIRGAIKYKWVSNYRLFVGQLFFKLPKIRVTTLSFSLGSVKLVIITSLIFNKYRILRLIVIFLLMVLFSTITLAEDIPQKEDPAWIDETMEEMVMPLKQWLEYNDNPPTALPTPASKSMRQAIKEATSSYPGVVLSVKKLEAVYQVKILSEQGVVQLIDISMALPEATP